MTLIGKQITSYVIKAKLGAGGMGEVYLAEDTRLGRQVALKFLPDEIARKKHAVDRFQREARAASTLNHPNICTIHDIGEHEGRPFFVMELLEGSTLADRIKGHTLPAQDVLDFGIQIADGLEAAHSKGIIHRDIKPGNIHVNDKGHVKILDFGLAKLKQEDADTVAPGSTFPTEDPHLTTSGMTVGTVAYMSPEQARGRTVDARTDIFSFGAVLYEMATGQRAFVGNSAAEMFDAILNRQPVSPARANHNLPDGLEQIILKALEKDPDLRYQSVADLRSDLKRLVRDISSSYSHPPVTEQVQSVPDESSAAGISESRASSDAEIARTLIRRHRKAVLMGVVGLLAITATIIYLMSGRKTISPETGKIDSLAVMYFENLTDHADSDSTARMLSNLLTTELSRSENLNVVSSQRLYDISRQLGKGDAPIDRSVATEVAERAKVTTMVLGQVAKVGTRWVATTELVEVSSGRVLGSQKAEGQSMEDIFRMAEVLGEQIRSYAPQSLVSETGGKPLAQQMTHSVEAYRSFVRGEARLQRQQFREAAEEYRRAVNADPNFAMAYYKWSIAASWLFDQKVSEEAINNALRLADRLPPVYLDLSRAFLFFVQEKYSQAIPLLESVLKRDPENKEALYVLSEIYMHSVRDVNPLRAAEVMEKLLALDPDFHLVYAHLGLAYALSADFKKTEELLDRWEGQEPETVLVDRALVASLQNRFEDALEISRDVSKFQIPDLLRAYWAIGLSKWETVDELLGSSPSDEGWNRAYGLYLSALLDSYRGRFNSALITIRQQEPEFIPRQKEGPVVAAVAATLRLKIDLSILKGDLKTAQDDAGRLLALVPEYPASIYDVARLSVNAGNLQKANDLLKRFEGLRMNTANSTIDLFEGAVKAEILLAQGQNPEAIELLQELSKSDKLYADYFAGGWVGWVGSGTLHHSLGRAYLAMDNEAKSVEAFETFLNSDLEHVNHPVLYMKTLLQVAKLRSKAGDREGARKCLETILEHWGNADWDLAEVREARAQLKSLQ